MHRISARTARLFAAAGLGAMLLGAPVAFAGGPAIPEGTGIDSWVDNGQGGVYLFEVREGSLPEGETAPVGEVIADINCGPDADNINHCENEIRFSDGSTMKGVNNHRMAVNRCLKPGEKVSVSYLQDGWAVVSVGAE